MSESFILQSYIQDLSVCDALIQMHEDNPTKHVGMINRSGETVLDKTVKDSEESFIFSDTADLYFTQLQNVIDEYIQKYPQSNMYASFGLSIYPQIQKYRPGGGYFDWHTERSHANNQQIASRHLVFMTYLNDVTDAGETEFALQNLKVAPRKGLTLIWPADWTHTHRGIVSPTQEKYIVTGWLNYL
jgi:hypothetical protein